MAKAKKSQKGIVQQAEDFLTGSLQTAAAREGKQIAAAKRKAKAALKKGGLLGTPSAPATLSIANVAGLVFDSGGVLVTGSPILLS